MANIKAESNALTLGELLTSQELRDTLTDVFANLSVESLLNLRLTNKHLKTAVDNFVIQTLKQEFPGEIESLGENASINKILLAYKNFESLKEYFDKLSNSDSDKILKTHCLAYLICKYPSNTKAKDYFIENGADLKAAEELLQSLKTQKDLNLYLENTFTWDSLYLLKTVLLMGADFGCALRRETRAGKTERVKLLLAADKQTKAVNAKDKYGWTALMLAAQRGHLEAVQALLTNSKIDVNAKNVHDWTALMLAAQRGHLEAVQALLAHSEIDVNATDNDGKTALMLAAGNGRSKTVEALLTHNKIDVNAKNKDGKTALMWAACRGHLEAVQALLAHSEIDVNTTDNDGKTALSLAIENRRTEVVNLLKTHIANKAQESQRNTPNTKGVDRTSSETSIIELHSYNPVINGFSAGKNAGTGVTNAQIQNTEQRSFLVCNIV